MRLANLATFHQRQKMFGHGFLARMRTRVLQTRIECSGRAFERFETHRAGHIGDACQALRTQDRQSADRVHGLRAIEQGQTFLRFQFDRFQFCALQRFRSSPSVLLQKILRLRRSRSMRDAPAARDRHSRRPSLFPEQPDAHGG